MPVLQQAPQQVPPPQEAPQGVTELLAQRGIGPVQPVQRSLFTALIEDNLRQEYEQQNRPVFKGFARDLVNTAVGTGKDIWRALFVGDNFNYDLPGNDLIRQDMANTQMEAESRLANETNPSLVDVLATTFTKGVVSGFDFGLRNLPVIGDYFHSYLGPANEALEVAATNAVSRSLNAMNSKFGQATLVEIPAIVSGLGGTLSGGYVTLKPWLGLGNVVVSGATRVRGAASFAEGLRSVSSNLNAIQSGFVGDIAGGIMFGAATGERGFISGAVEGPVEARYGQRLFEMPVDPRDPWWKQSIAETVNRAEAGLAMGVDTFVMGALFTTMTAMGTMGTYATAKMKNMRTDLLGGEPIDAAKIMAMRQADILSTPGKRQFAVLRTPAEAEAYIDIRAHEELINASAGARRILAEQASVEGIVSYHTQIAAVAKAIDELHVNGEATHGVLRGVEDPYRMLQEVQKIKPVRIANTPKNISEIVDEGLRIFRTSAKSPVNRDRLVGRLGTTTTRDEAVSVLEEELFNPLAEWASYTGTAQARVGHDEVAAFDTAANSILDRMGFGVRGDRLRMGRASNDALMSDIQSFRQSTSPTTDSPISLAAQTFRSGGEIRPIVHTVEEIPENGIFGYTEGWTRDPLSNHVRTVDRNVPIFLKNRPKAPAVERGNVEEVIVVPAKTWEFESWNNVMEKHGSVDDMIRAARKNNVEVVNVRNTGAEGGIQHVVLDPAAIKSAKAVTPSSVESMMGQPVDADRILAEMGEEPLEVALKRRMPGYRFETPIRREDGTYDLIFSPEGAPGLSGKQLKQFKETGYFSGQSVMYGGKTWQVVRRRGKGGKGRSIEIKDPTSGTIKSVSVNNVFEFPSAHVDMPVDDALYRDWLTFFDDKMKLVGDRQIDEAGLREIAMASEDPARLNRDFADRGLNAIIHPHEMMAEIDIADALAARVKEIDTQIQSIGMDMTQAAQIQTLMKERVALQQQVQASAMRAQQEGKISADIDLDNAFVDFPDEMDYGTVIFQDWAQARNVQLSPGEAMALKNTFYRRMNEELFSKLPTDIKASYQKIQDELVDYWENLPQNLDTTAAMAGFEVLRLKNNTLALRRPGSIYYEGLFTSEDAARAALQRSIRYGGTPNMTPQYNYLNVALPSGPGLSPVAGVNSSDVHYMLGDEAKKYLSYAEEWGSGKYLTGKPAWLVPVEEKSGIPLWTELVEPTLLGEVHASNAQIPFLSRYIEGFEGTTLDNRLRVRDFIRTVESHTEFLDGPRVIAKAKEFGLNSLELKALQGHRAVMDEMFQIGTRLYGWTPTDYLYSYLTKMWPQNQAYIRGDLVPNPTRRFSGLVPDEMDVFASKYSREGMLPIEEEDPLVIGMKYIRTFFHEAHVRRPYERLAEFLNIKLKDLPPEQANKIISEMPPTIRRQLAKGSGDNILNAFALPNTIRMPLKEMQEYMRGMPNEAGDLALNMIKKFTNILGVKMDDRTASEIVNSGMLGMYGATLAMRPKPVVRNIFQVIGNLGARTSFSAVEIGMKRAIDPEAFARAVDDGIIDMTARGLPFGQEMTIQALEAAPMETKGFMGAVTGGMLRATMLDGALARNWRRFAERGLAGIGKTDMFTRVAAAETADVFVRPWATKYLAGSIDEAKLVRKALPYWETPIRNKFVKLLDEGGIEPAMSYIRRETSNISNYIYSKPAQPTALQKPIGRMAFQFGIWPIWRKDLLVRSIRNARGLDEKFQYMAKEAMIWGALALTGARLGINMTPWMSHEALMTFSGGPIIGVAADLHNLMSQREYSGRVESMRRLVNDNAIRVFPVGRIFGEDVVNSIKYAKDDPIRGFLHMTFGRPVEDDLSWSERMMYMVKQSEMEQRALSGGETPAAAPNIQAPRPQVVGPFPAQPKLNF